MSGGGAFGFEVPTGNPGALDSAAASWRELGIALDQQAVSIGVSTSTALSVGNWEGSAASAFADKSERLIGVYRTNLDACRQAATALTSLARALEQAQQVTRQALADCQQAQSEITTQQSAADTAGAAARSAQQAADTAPHPSVATALAHEAAIYSQQQTAAQNAVTHAQDALNAARTRGHDAIVAYRHEVQAASSQLSAAAGELRPAPELGAGWADSIVTWLGHANDFSGAGATAVVKTFDKVFERMSNTLTAEVADFAKEPSEWVSASGGLLEPGITGFDLGGATPDEQWRFASGFAQAADNPVIKGLTSGLPEDTFGVLGKVPYVGWGLTAADGLLHWKDGIGQSVIKPVGNLAVGTITAEATSSGLGALAASDGVIGSVAGAAAIPGVGEFVVTGLVVVGAVYGADKLGTLIWNDRKAIWHGLEDAGQWTYHAGTTVVHGIEHGADWAYHEGKSLVHGAEHLLSDLNPF